MIWLYFALPSAKLCEAFLTRERQAPHPGLPFFFPAPAHRIWHRTRGEWWSLHTDIEERACDLAVYIIEHRATVRAAAKQFGISKSTVHKDLSQRLPTFDRPLYLQVKEILEVNKAERHIRGGIATRRKYKGG